MGQRALLLPPVEGSLWEVGMREAVGGSLLEMRVCPFAGGDLAFWLPRTPC